MHAPSTEVEALEIGAELAPHAAQMPSRGGSANVSASHLRQTELPQKPYLIGPLLRLLKLPMRILGLLSELIFGLLRLLGILQRITTEQ